MDRRKKSERIVITNYGLLEADGLEVVVGLEYLTFFKPESELGNEEVA